MLSSTVARGLLIDVALCCVCRAHVARLDRLCGGTRLPGGGGRRLGLRCLLLVAGSGRRCWRWEVGWHCGRAEGRNCYCCRFTHRAAVAGEHRQLGELLGDDGVGACRRRIPRTPEAFLDTLPDGLDECDRRHRSAWQKGSSCALDNDAACCLRWVDGCGHDLHLTRFVHWIVILGLAVGSVTDVVIDGCSRLAH